MKNTSNFDVSVTSEAGAPELIFQFRGDTVHADLAGARLYGEAEGDDRTWMSVRSATGDVLADITLHPRPNRDATENVVDIGSALLWSHWRWVQA